MTYEVENENKKERQRRGEKTEKMRCGRV